jgi:hypothetical protein
VVVVSHSSQLTSSMPSSRAVIASGEPHSAHSGPATDPAGISAVSVRGGAVPSGIGPSTNVVTR